MAFGRQLPESQNQVPAPLAALLPLYSFPPLSLEVDKLAMSYPRAGGVALGCSPAEIGYVMHTDIVRGQV